MLALENRIKGMLTLHTNPQAVHGRSTLKDDCEHQFWNGPFREFKERINDVHEQLTSTIYEQSISCCTRSNKAVPDESTIPDVNKWKSMSEGSDNFAMLKRCRVTKKEGQRDLSTGNQMHSFMSVVTMKCLIVILFIVFMSFIRSEVFIVTLNFCMLMLIVSLIFYILYIVVGGCMLSAEAVLLNTFVECDIFEKTMDLSLRVHGHVKDDMFVSIDTIKCRSRYEKFIYYNQRRIFCQCHVRNRRDRAPSRVPLKKLERLSRKNRILKKYVWKGIRKNTPRSSSIFRFIGKCCKNQNTKCTYGNHWVRFVRKMKKKRIRKRSKKYYSFVNYMRYKRHLSEKGIKKAIKYFTLFTCNISNVFKSLNHKRNVCKFSLCRDIEKNPGPSRAINHTKTITAPYSQGNVALFGLNAGQQCMAMSLCALIYNYANTINTSSDLVTVMNIGNELYSGLSRLSCQSYLMLTELPELVTVLNKTYQLKYSPSYSGNLHADDCGLDDFAYCMPLDSALESLKQENFNSFLLTVEYNTVAIYYTNDCTYKIFDAHARDVFGMSHPQGTCVLLEVASTNDLKLYFQSFYKNASVSFELGGVLISQIQSTEDSSMENGLQITTCERDASSKQLSDSNGNTGYVDQCLTMEGIAYQSVRNPNKKDITIINVLKQCCAMSFYCICFSVIKSCGYWNSQTLDAIITHGTEFYTKTLSGNKGGLSLNHLPNRIKIRDADIDISIVTKQGILSFNSYTSRISFRKLILENISNTGFVLWFFNYCLSCVLQHNGQRKTRSKYCLAVFSSNGRLDKFENINNTDSLIQAVVDTMTTKFKCNEIQYCVKFLYCASQLSNITRQKIVRMFQSTGKRKLTADVKKEKYAEMEPRRKKRCLSRKVQWFHSLDDTEKHKRNMRKKLNYGTSKHMTKDLDYYISSFQNKIKNGPFFICSVCNRLLYRKTVIQLKQSQYSLQNLFTDVKSYDDKQYICTTCHSKVSKGKVPCQAVSNKMHVDAIPPELAILEKLEQILIAQRIVFEKIVIMPKGQQKKIKGAICNVPVHCDQTCHILPRPPERSGIIMLKLKRKLEFKGHVYFQAVRPEAILHGLNWLRINNSFYHNVGVDLANIDSILTTFQQNESISEGHTDLLHDQILSIHNSNSVSTNTHDIASDSTPDDYEEDKEDPLNEYRVPINETCLQSVIPDYPVTLKLNENISSGNEVYSIAPGENKHPVSLMTDEHCEELAFPVLFPKGKFGYTVHREIKLSPVKYFNSRLLHHSGRFATNPEYLFFAQFIIEQKKISDSINIALKKVHGQLLTACQIRSNIENLQNLICQDQAYLFLRHIPGTPPYWQKFMYDILAMVKQLGIPTWFMTLSCADLRWPELFQIITRTQGKNITDEEVNALSYNERCSLLNLNPVVVAKHFQYRVETFFTEVLLSSANPLGKIVYYALRIEFQMRGSPHLHALVWTSDCPKLTSNSKEDYINFVDQHVQAFLPSREDDAELYELVSTFQKHSHSKTCRKYKNVRCRFNFGQFFTNRTIVAQPLSNDLNDTQKTNVIERRQKILTLVKGKIDDVLNPSKPNYNSGLTEKDIFTSVGITEEQYYWALSISPNTDYELHLKRPIDSCFINNYFIAGTKGFRANVDLQPIFNHYKCITYVCSYFTKDETECSQAIVNAAKEAMKDNLNIRERLKKIGAAFLSTREVSSQECVYRCMPELWLRKIFPATVFVNTNLPEKRVCVPKSQQELDELDDDSTDIFRSNIIDRYTLRPNSSSDMENLCLAEFAAYYYKDYKSKDQETTDCQPEVLTNEAIEIQHNCTDVDCLLPNQIKLLNTNESMKRRKIKAVIRYHTPSKTKEPELFFHHLLMLYFPWRDENSLLGRDQTYSSKFYEPNVQILVEENRQKFEPDADAVMETLEYLRNNEGIIFHSYDSMNDQENADMRCDLQEDLIPEESFNHQLPSHLSTSSATDQHCNLGTIIFHNQPGEISDDELRTHVRSLNTQQRYAYDIVLTWCRNKVKSLNSLKPQETKPIYLFVTGGAGAGKSHLIKTIYHTASKTFRHTAVNFQFPSVLLMAPTGVAAINIDGTTINTALAIPREPPDSLSGMSDEKRTQMRLSLSELKLIIIDEISMVANITLIHINQRLKEIFDIPDDQLFAGLSILAVGDLYQLPPIKRKPVFANYKKDAYNLWHPWQLFTMIELTEIMRQKDDQPFAQLLNRFRTANQIEEDMKCIQSRSTDPSDVNYPSDVLHIWAENYYVDQHNNLKLRQIPKPLFHLKATDQYPPNVSKERIDSILSKGRSDTGGLDSNIYIKETARVMLTTNMDIADRLINGQLGTVARIEVNPTSQQPAIIYVKFDDVNAGKEVIAKSTNSFIRENRVVPIQPILRKIRIQPGRSSSPEIQRMQFPVTLAYAVTIHKVQGLSLNEIVVSFQLHKQTAFNSGQVYVALSRCTSLSGLHILGNIDKKPVRVDHRVHKEYERLRNMPSVSNIPTNQDETAITLCLLNVRSLTKHCFDIKCDSNIFNCDLLALTETHLLPHNSTNDVIQHLHPFTLYRQDHPSDRYSSLAVCTKPNVEAKKHEYFPEINGLKFIILNKTQLSCTSLLLYRKNTLNTIQFVDALRHILDTHSIDMIFGDFNMNYLDDSNIEPLESLMKFLNYTQIVQSPTFVSSGSTLDLIYLKPTMFHILQNSVISVYYSDHDAVKILLKFK